MPETATWWRSVVCLAPFIYPTSAGPFECRAAPSPGPTWGHISAFSPVRPCSSGGDPLGLEKSLSLLKLRLLTTWSPTHAFLPTVTLFRRICRSRGGFLSTISPAGNIGAQLSELDTLRT